MFLLLAAVLSQPTALYEFDRQDGTVELVLALAGDGLDQLGSPSYSPDEQSIAIDATKDNDWNECRIIIWNRDAESLTDVGQGNYPVWTSDNAAVVYSTFYGSRSLRLSPVDPDGKTTDLGLKRYNPELSPDGAYVLTSSVGNSTKAENVRVAPLDRLDAEPFTLDLEIGSFPEFAHQPGDSPSAIATLVATSRRSERNPSAILAIDISGSDPSDPATWTATPRELLAANKTYRGPDLPSPATTTDAVAFRYTRAGGGLAVGVLQQDRPGEVVTVLAAPKGVRLEALRMSSSGRYICFKSDLFHLGPIDGRLLEPADLLARPAAADSSPADSNTSETP